MDISKFFGLVYISTIIAFFGYMLMALFLLMRNRFSKVNLIFCFWLLVWSCWNFFVFILYSANTEILAYRYAIFVHGSLAFMHTALFHLSVVLTDRRDSFNKKLLFFSYLSSLGFLLVALFKNDLWVAEMKQYAWGFTPIIGVVGHIHAIFFFTFLYLSFRNIFRQLKLARGRYRNQLKFIYGGLLSIYLLSMTNFLPVMGYPVPPLGNLVSVPVLIVMFYSIVKYETFDVKVFFRRSVVFMLFTVFILSLGFGTLFFTRKIFDPIFGQHDYFIVFMYSIVLIILINPVIRLAEQASDLIFRKGSYDRKKINTFYQILRENLNSPQNTLNLITAKLIETFNFDYVSLKYFSIPSNQPYSGCTFKKQLKIDEREIDLFFEKNEKTIINYFYSRNVNYLDLDVLTFEIIKQTDRETKEKLRDLVSEMEKISLVAICMIGGSGGHIKEGYLFLGSSDARAVSFSEITIIENLITSIQIAITNAELYVDALSKQKNLDRLEKIAILGQMSQGIAHEIKNPLMSIKSYFELSHSLTEEDKNNFMVTAKDQINKINDLLKKLMRYTHPDKINKVKVDIKTMVSKIEVFLKPEFVSKGVTFQNLLNEPIMIEVDPDKYEQALTNLILNAIQAKDSTKSLCWVRIYYDESLRRLTISDNGTGMTIDKLEKIFTPFFTTKKGSGTGLGLSIVQNIIEAHGGHIEVNSKVDEGTHFYIYF